VDLAKESLRKLSADAELGGHLVGASVDALLKTFEARFVAELPRGGDWAERIAAASAAGATELAVPASAFFDGAPAGDKDRAAAEIRKACDAEGVRLAAIDLDYASAERFRAGALAHADGSVRRAALAWAVEATALAGDLGAERVRIDTSADGWDRPFQVNHGAALQHVLDACEEINSKAREADVLVTLAPAECGGRPGGAIVDGPAAGAFVADRVNRDGGGKNVGLAIDCGGAAPSRGAARAIYFLRVAGVPLHEISLGRAPVAAMLDSWALADALYAAVDTGFDGAFVAGAPTRADLTERSLTVARELFANALRRALLVYRDKDVLLKAQAEGGAAAVACAVARAVDGGLPIRVVTSLKGPAKKRPTRAGR
jgi:xylose isomerase